MDDAKYLSVPQPRFDVRKDENTFLIIDADGEVAYFAARTGQEWIHPGWKHHLLGFHEDAERHFRGDPLEYLT